tara:strand:- start:425 stop:613 length:189 start_codon:yes stop_codon:yes gene_type:complete
MRFSSGNLVRQVFTQLNEIVQQISAKDFSAIIAQAITDTIGDLRQKIWAITQATILKAKSNS